MVEKFWFTSDLHLGHKNILRLANRPFKTIEENDEYIISKFNELVTPEDTVYILGDISFNQSYNSYKELFTKLNGKINIILGNHDNKQHLIRCQKDGLIENVRESQILNIGDDTIHLTHYPLREWFNFYHNGYHLYGHVHGTLNDYCKSTDVGVECWEYGPVEWTELKEYIDQNCTDNEHT